MENKSKLLGIILIIGCLLFIVLAWSSFRYMKNMENEFNEKKAILIKENLDLKGRLRSLQDVIAEKTEAITMLEKAKTSMETDLDLLKENNKKLKEQYAQDLGALKKENDLLAQKISELDKMPLIERLGRALEREEDENIRKVLEEALNNISLIESGQIVDLEPIVVREKEMLPRAAARIGNILSVNKRHKLVAVNLGRLDGVREGDRCIILKDEKEIARGEIISVRYRISAALINKFKFGYSTGKIKKGYKALIE